MHEKIKALEHVRADRCVTQSSGNDFHKNARIHRVCVEWYIFAWKIYVAVCAVSKRLCLCACVCIYLACACARTKYFTKIAQTWLGTCTQHYQDMCWKKTKTQILASEDAYMCMCVYTCIHVYVNRWGNTKKTKQNTQRSAFSIYKFN